MIQSITLKNFRNFQNKVVFFDWNINSLYGENGKGKTSIIEAISLFSHEHLGISNFSNMLKTSESSFFIQAQTHSDVLSIAYDKETQKKKYSLNKKVTNKKKFFEASYRASIFSPTTMNMFLLGPKHRRHFLDTALLTTYDWYKKLYKDYWNVVSQRNAILKSIQSGKSQRSELQFWDNEYLANSLSIYRYRYLFVKYLQEHSNSFLPYIANVSEIDLRYISKVNLYNPEQWLLEKLKNNREKEIILWRTLVWPHVDDFQIYIDWQELALRVSRWEMKSVIFWLKLLEAQFIEAKQAKKPILLIDDFMSELDEKHQKLLLKKISDYQVIMSDIKKLSLIEGNFIKL